MADEYVSKGFLTYIPDFLKNPAIWVSIIVGFYVILLGLCLTGALNRQKVAIGKARGEKKYQSSTFSMLDEDSDHDS